MGGSCQLQVCSVYLKEKKEEKSLKYSLDMSITRLALARTSSSEDYHSRQLRQNLSAVLFSSSLSEKTLLLYKLILTLQLPQIKLRSVKVFNDSSFYCFLRAVFLAEKYVP